MSAVTLFLEKCALAFPPAVVSVLPTVVLSNLNTELQNKTFVSAGHAPSFADAELFASLHPIITAEKSSLHQYPNVIRYFTLIQALPAIAQAASEAQFALIDLESEKLKYIPNVRKAEVKVKKIVPSTSAAGKSKAEETAAAKESPKEGAPVPSKEKKGKKETKPAAPQPAAVSSPSPSMIDLRVGRIISVQKHPEADSLYIEQIDVGEPEPRTVVSGLVNYIPIEEMQGKWLVAVCNLKPASMRGVKSFAMVLAATAKDGKDGLGSVELMAPPEGSQPGDRVYFEGFESAVPEAQLNPKKKVFETVQPGFTTLDDKQGAWVNPENGSVHRILTSRGPVKAPNHVGASLS